MYIQNLGKHNWEKQIEKVKKDWNIELKKNGFELERAIQYNGFAFKNDDVLYHLKGFNSLKFIPHFKFLKQYQNGDEKKKDLLVSSLFYALSLKNYFIEADVNIGENLSVDNVKILKNGKIIKELKGKLFDKRILHNITDPKYMEKQQKMWSQIQLLNTLSNKFIITWLGGLDFMLYACKNTGKNKYEFVEQKVTFDNKLYSTEYSGVLGVVICHGNTNDTKITVFTTTGDIFSFSQDLIHDFLIHRDNIKIIDKDIGTLGLTLFQNKNGQLEIVDLDYSLKMRWLNFFTNAKNLNDNVKIIDVRPLNLSKESKDFFYENNISAIQAFSETKDGFHLQNIGDERAFLIVRKKGFWEMKEGILVDYFKKENNIHGMLLRYDLNNAIYKIYSIILNKEGEIIEETEIYKTNTLEHPPILHTFLLKNKKCLYFISQSTTEKQKVFLGGDKGVKELSAPNFVLLKKLEIQGKWYVWDNNYNVYILDENNYCFKKIENDRMFPLIRFAKISTKRNLSVQKCFDNLQMPMFKPPLQMNFDENMLDKIKRNEAFESCLFQEFALVNYGDKKHFISLKEMKKINNLNYKTHAESLSSINEKYPICLSVIHTYGNLLQSEIMSLKKQNKFLNLRGKKLY